MYHGTPNHQPTSEYSINARQFKAQLAYLKKKGWVTALFRDLQDTSKLADKTVILTFDDGYANNFEGAFVPLVENAMKATWFITTDCIGKHALWMGTPRPETQMLTVGQLLQMNGSGMEIGSHTCSHPDLSALTYPVQVDEMSRSKQLLETLINSEVTSFAYPYGRYNNDSLMAAKAAGFQVACSVKPGWFSSGDDLFLVRRVTVFANDSVSTLARKLIFADNDVSWQKLARYYFGRINEKLASNH